VSCLRTLMTAPVYPHLVFTLSRPHCSTSKHYGGKSQCQIVDLKEVSGVCYRVRRSWPGARLHWCLVTL